jgi:RHS repeat-associated protein
MTVPTATLFLSRTWLNSLQVGSVYSFSGVTFAGNGNVLTAYDKENGNWTYGYDGVNRLQTATATGQSFTYGYDNYGNMTCQQGVQGGAPCNAITYDPANNQISDGGIHQYDAAGNLTQDGTHGYIYDAENRITCVLGTDGTCTSASAMLYFYDAQGQRVGKQQADTLEDYVYDPKGHLTSVHDGSANLLRSELYSPDGRHVATLNGNSWSTSGLFWNHADWLGTERVRTNFINGTASVVETCTDTPFGMNLNCTPPPDQSPMHFTGKQRDYETGLDYFGARYLGSGNNLGRFMTPDAFFMDSHVADPQSWNEYAYVRNNPLRNVDPTGNEATVSSSCASDPNGHTTCNVSVTASIAIYAVNGTTNAQLQQAQSAITQQVDKAWSGTFEQDGTTYNVTTNVTVTIADSQKTAFSSGAQNAVGIDASGQTANSAVHWGGPLTGQDRGTWDFSSITSGGLAAHEFSHILGLDDNHGSVLSNADANLSRATGQDMGWAFEQAGAHQVTGTRTFNVGQFESYDILGNNHGNRTFSDAFKNPRTGKWWWQ